MLSKKLHSKPEASVHFDVTEKIINMGEEEAFKQRAGRKRHSVQLDKKISLQLQSLADRRSSNASSGGDSVDSLCE